MTLGANFMMRYSNVHMFFVSFLGFWFLDSLFFLATGGNEAALVEAETCSRADVLTSHIMMTMSEMLWVLQVEPKLLQ